MRHLRSLLGDIKIDLCPDNRSFNETNTKNYINLLTSICFANVVLSPTRYGQHKTSITDHILVNCLCREIKTCHWTHYQRTISHALHLFKPSISLNSLKIPNLQMLLTIVNLTSFYVTKAGLATSRGMPVSQLDPFKTN